MTRQLTIGVDVRPAAQHERRGIGHYAVEIISRMVRAHRDQDWEYLCLGAQPDLIPTQLLDGATLHRSRVGKLTAHHLAARCLRRWDDRRLGRLDVFFAPSAHLLALDPALPVVVTVHDTFWATTLRLMTERERMWHRVARPATLYQRAARLLANSDTTARKIKELLPQLADRVAVVPHGVDAAYTDPVTPEALAGVASRLKLPDEYILFLGGIEPRKNVRRLIDAFQIARRRGVQHELVLAGPLPAESRIELRGSNLAHVHILGFVNEMDKPGLYTKATAFALPAVDEGLGLPPLEALACGTPSLVSNLEIFRETLADSALMADPYDLEALADGLYRLCTDQRLRETLLETGRRRLARYDWDVCAEATYQAIVAASRE